MGRRGTPPAEMDVKSFQHDAIARDGMLHGAKRLKGRLFNAEAFCCADNFQIRLLNRSSRRQSALTFLAVIMSGLIPLCGTATWVWMDFNIWEFPQMRIHNAGWPLPDEKASLLPDNKRHEMPGRAGGSSAEVGQLPDAVFAKGDAKFFHRANRALRLARGADQRVKFHERLVQK